MSATTMESTAAVEATATSEAVEAAAAEAMEATAAAIPVETAEAAVGSAHGSGRARHSRCLITMRETLCPAAKTLGRGTTLQRPRAVGSRVAASIGAGSRSERVMHAGAMLAESVSRPV